MLDSRKKYAFICSCLRSSEKTDSYITVWGKTAFHCKTGHHPPKLAEQHAFVSFAYEQRLLAQRLDTFRGFPLEICQSLLIQ